MPFHDIQWYAVTCHGAAWYGKTGPDRPRHGAEPGAGWAGPATVGPPRPPSPAPTRAATLARLGSALAPALPSTACPSRASFNRRKWNALPADPSAFFYNKVIESRHTIAWILLYGLARHASARHGRRGMAGQRGTRKIMHRLRLCMKLLQIIWVYKCSNRWNYSIVTERTLL